MFDRRETGVCQPAGLESKAVPHFRNLARHSRSFLVAGPDQAVSLRMPVHAPYKALWPKPSSAVFFSFKPTADRAEHVFHKVGRAFQ